MVYNRCEGGLILDDSDDSYWRLQYIEDYWKDTYNEYLEKFKQTPPVHPIDVAFYTHLLAWKYNTTVESIQLRLALKELWKPIEENKNDD